MTQLDLYQQARAAGPKITALVSGLTEINPSFWAGPCPFCQGTDRFVVKQLEGGQQVWYCRQCGGEKYHDIVDLVAKRDRIKPDEAARKILELPASKEAVKSGKLATRPKSEPAKLLELPSKAWQDAAWIAIMPAAKLLQEGYELLDSGGNEPHIRAARYLFDRGILSPDAIRFLLGFSPTDTKAAGYAFPAGITIPHVVYSGSLPELWAVKVRRGSNKQGQKYRNYTGGTAGVLFNSQAAAGRPVAFVVEGEFDAILLQSAIDAAGIDAAAVTLGSASAKIQPEQWTHKLGHLWQLVVNYDSDQAGQEGQAKWLAAYSHAKAARQPIGDVTDYWRQYGQRGLIDWLRAELTA